MKKHKIIAISLLAITTTLWTQDTSKTAYDGIDIISQSYLWLYTMKEEKEPDNN